MKRHCFKFLGIEARIVVVHRYLVEKRKTIDE